MRPSGMAAPRCGRSGAVLTEVLHRTPACCLLAPLRRARGVTAARSEGSGGGDNQRSTRAPSVKAKGLGDKQRVGPFLDLEHVDALTTVTSTTSSTAEERPAAGWGALPARYKVMVGCASSFIICNMVNISIAIIPMAADFGWSPSVSGIVQSAFFYGYMLSQLPGGYLASTFGGRKVLPASLVLCSMATAGVPLLATTVPGLCASRAAVGLGMASAPSAAVDLVARVIPAHERSRAVSFIFSGLHVGSIIGLLAAPPLISNFGWESVFFTFGGLGFVWYLWFENVLSTLQRQEPEFVASLAGRSAAPAATEGVAADSHGAATDADQPIPWRAFLRSRPVQALMYTHFCNNWFHYTMLAWLPTYFTDTLSVDLMHAAQTALLPPLAGIAASWSAGPLADALVASGMPVATVRKLAQCFAFLVPSAFLLWACTPNVMDSTNLTVASITLSLGISSFSLAGLYCTHQDLSPKYASAMLGLTNTVGAIPGIVGVTTVGILYDATQSWELALFVPSAFLMLTGAAVYTLLCDNSPVDFDAANNKPFAWENLFKRASADDSAAGKDQ